MTVPTDPLTAIGLAMPWQLENCDESTNGVFVQAVIFDLHTHQLTTYDPLMINAGQSPLVAPTIPTLPLHHIVGIWGGSNDDTTVLNNPQGCVNGADGKPFGQVFFCNATKFFAAVNAAHIYIPPIGRGATGDKCLTTRSWRVVDQDQSDNVQTTYLYQNGQTAQNTAANRAALPGAQVVTNPSDNVVLAAMDAAIGCTPWMIPDIADNNTLVPTQATDELQAAAYQEEPQALIPSGDPMTGPNNLAMVNAYRLGVDQPTIENLGQANTQVYCNHIRNHAPTWLAKNQTLLQAAPSPVAGFANLYDLLTTRLAATFVLLKCK